MSHVSHVCWGPGIGRDFRALWAALPGKPDVHRKAQSSLPRLGELRPCVRFRCRFNDTGLLSVWSGVSRQVSAFSWQQRVSAAAQQWLLGWSAQVQMDVHAAALQHPGLH